jgi:hypothetical protein
MKKTMKKFPVRKSLMKMEKKVVQGARKNKKASMSSQSVPKHTQRTLDREDLANSMLFGTMGKMSLE